MSEDHVDVKAAVKDLPQTAAVRYLQSVSVDLEVKIRHLEELAGPYDARVEFAIVGRVFKVAVDVVRLVCAELERK